MDMDEDDGRAWKDGDEGTGNMIDLPLLPVPEDGTCFGDMGNTIECQRRIEERVFFEVRETSSAICFRVSHGMRVWHIWNKAKRIPCLWQVQAEDRMVTLSASSKRAARCRTRRTEDRREFTKQPLLAANSN